MKRSLALELHCLFVSDISKMWAKDLFAKTPLCQYGAVLKGMPRGVLFNRRLILTALLYATSAVPLSG